MGNRKANEIGLKGGFFCPIEDDRVIDSGIDDIEGGDNFFDYAEYFYREYGSELFDVDFDVEDSREEESLYVHRLIQHACIV